VLVVGAARSGVAAALLLVRRGAMVTLTDRRRPRCRGDSRAPPASRSSWEGTRRRASARRPGRASPGVPLELPGSARAAAGVPVVGELELASRWLRGAIVAITGTKGKSTTTTTGGRHARGRGPPRAGRRQHRRAAQRAGGELHRRHRARRRGEQLPARDDRHVPPVDCGAAELLAGSPRPASRCRGVCARPRRGSSPTRTPTTGRW
jgi:hypothetical protein